MGKAFWGVVAFVALLAASGAELYTGISMEGRVSAADINDNEEVVGGGGMAYYSKASGAYEIYNGLAGSITYPYGNIYGINNRGVMVGYSYTGTNNGGPLRAFVLDRAVGVARDLGSLSGPSGGSKAWAINESNVIVGESETTNGTHAVRFNLDGTITDLRTLGGTTSVAYDINENGEIVGESKNAAGQRRAFVIHGRDTMVDLGTLGGTEAYAKRINNKGQIVGAAATASGDLHAFVWMQGAMTDLGTFEYPFSEALGINDDGVVVGRSRDGIGRLVGFVWYPGGPIKDLGPLAKLPGEDTPYEALDINNNGLILISIFHPSYRTGFGHVGIFRPGASSATVAGGQMQLKIGAPPGFRYDAQVDSTQDFTAWSLGTPTRFQGEQMIHAEALANGARFFRVSISPAASR